MGGYLAKPAVDEDLIHSARWIALDDSQAAVRFLDAAFKTFNLVAQFPEAGPKARLKHSRLREVRFRVLAPPFNRWLIFYRIETGNVVILRVLHGSQNWRERTEELL